MTPESVLEKPREETIKDVLAVTNSRRINIIATNVPPACFKEKIIQEGISAYWFGTNIGRNSNAPPTGILTELEEEQPDGSTRVEQTLFLNGEAHKGESKVYPEGTLPSEFRGLI